MKENLQKKNPKSTSWGGKFHFRGRHPQMLEKKFLGRKKLEKIIGRNFLVQKTQDIATDYKKTAKYGTVFSQKTKDTKFSENIMATDRKRHEKNAKKSVKKLANPCGICNN